MTDLHALNYEQGVIKLPANAWHRFADVLVANANLRQQRMLALARELHPLVEAACPGFPTVRRALAAVVTERAEALMPHLQALDCWEGLVRGIVRFDTTRDCEVLRELPTAIHFPPIGLEEETRLFVGELTVRLTARTAEMDWRIEGGVGAVARARATDFGKAVFAALAETPWTAGTGGVLRAGRLTPGGPTEVRESFRCGS